MASLAAIMSPNFINMSLSYNNVKCDVHKIVLTFKSHSSKQTSVISISLLDWNRKKLWDEWMEDKAKTCDKAGVAVPPDGLSST